MKIGILGHFGAGMMMLNGQTVKTKNLVKCLEKYSNIEVVKVDSYGWKKNPLRLMRKIRCVFRSCDAIIMLPAQNGVKIFSPVLLFFKKVYHKKVFYDVIGGWLPDFLRKKRFLSIVLKNFNGVWVETKTMKQKLEKQGFKNIFVVPNFKELQTLNAEDLIYTQQEPFKLCTFSRVMKEKGIETAITAIKDVNKEKGHTIYELDIYGQVESGQEEWFKKLQSNFPEYIHYKGSIDSSESVNILKNYFAVLFPTHFYTEGIPGTVIDGYCAGVPVISSKWLSFSDVVDDKVTGYGYKFNDENALKLLLTQIASKPSMIFDLKENCIVKTREFMPSKVIKEIERILYRE